MNEPIFYPPFDTAVVRCAAETLRRHGMTIAEAPSPEVTHLLLPVPCNEDPEPVLRQLPSTVTVIGGRLDLERYDCMDLLEDDIYLAKNAMITAHIAVTLAARELPVIMEGCPVLILGWGRIGKCLTALLSAMGADVTVAARKPADRAMIEALGSRSADIHALHYILRRYRLIFNTVPFPVLGPNQLRYCRPDCVKIELASSPGIAGSDVIQARGLPGKYAPESSGKLIGQTIIRLLAQKEASS